MNKLIYGIEIFPKTHMSNINSRTAIVHKIQPDTSEPLVYKNLLPHTGSASSLYKYLTRRDTSEYDVIQFGVIYGGVVYASCLKKFPPPPRMMMHPWIRLNPVKGFFLENFKYRDEWDSKSDWTPSDIIYIE